MFYTIFCTLNGKTISTITGDYADDNAAIEKARWYQQSSAADTIRVYRDWMYPLGEMIAELKALPPDPENMNNDRAALPAAHSPTPWLQNGKAIYYRLDCGLTENIATVHGGEFGNPHPNAAFIVRAVNNYADLLDALQFCDITLADLETSERKGYIAEAKKQARAAIAKATA